MAKSISRFFTEELGVPLANARWSWGAADPAKERVVLRVWDDQLADAEATAQILLARDTWSQSSGFKERLEHLELLAKGARGYGVVCTAVDPTKNRPRRIQSFDGHWLLALGEVSHTSDGVYATIAGRISLEEYQAIWGKDGAGWNAEEYRDAVREYLVLLDRSRRGERVNKAALYRELAERHGRTAKAFEFRMQNVSYVMHLLGRAWVSGLKPASHVGPEGVAIIERLIAELEGTVSDGTAAFEAEVQALRTPGGRTPGGKSKKKPLVRPEGTASPAQVAAVGSQFVRDPRVKAWVLDNAQGRCELCGEPGPFETIHGDRFLEVHHVRALADGGTDRVENAVGVCPNCHRALHHAVGCTDLAETLYETVVRLNRE